MKISIPIYDNVIEVDPYKVKQVKEALFSLGQLTEDTIESKIDVLYRVLINKDNEKYDMYEKLFILLKVKSKIDDDEHTITYTCDKCKQVTEGYVNISNSMILENTDTNINNINIIYADTIEESISPEILDSLSIDEYNEVYNTFINIKPKLQFNTNCRCLICNNTSLFNLDMKYLTDLVLPIDFLNLYYYEVYMKTKGYSIQEISDMYPYEMNMYKDIIDKLTTPQG